MFKEVVRVSKVQKDKVLINFTKSEICDSCGVEDLCKKGGEDILIDRGEFSLEGGDQVEVAINEKMSLLASLLTFLLPALIFIAGLIIFKERGELQSFMSSLLLLCVYFIIFKLFLNKYGKTFKIRIIRKL